MQYLLILLQFIIPVIAACGLTYLYNNCIKKYIKSILMKKWMKVLFAINAIIVYCIYFAWQGKADLIPKININTIHVKNNIIDIRRHLGMEDYNANQVILEDKN